MTDEDLVENTPHEDCRVLVEDGHPVLKVGETKVRLRCIMTHEAFPDMTLEGEDLDAEVERLVDGAVWRVENGLESELDVTIQPEMIE